MWREGEIKNCEGSGDWGSFQNLNKTKYFRLHLPSHLPFPFPFLFQIPFPGARQLSLSNIKKTFSAFFLSNPQLTPDVLQEKQKGRNKLVPRLLGVTKDSVLRLDEKTKEILKTWPLTTVRRWAASPNVFTLDFGDYQVRCLCLEGTVHMITLIFFLKDQYYSVQTTEGEQISALIAGYIDIILKRRQRKERFGEDGNEEEYLEESFIHPGRAIEIHGLPQTLKKAKPDSLAKPGLLRNSGGKF